LYSFNREEFYCSSDKQTATHLQDLRQPAVNLWDFQEISHVYDNRPV